MSETENEFIFQELRSLDALKTVFDSFRILHKNPKIFTSIFALIILPLSLLLFTLVFISEPLKTQVYHKEALALVVPTRFEARQVWQEARVDSLTLLRLKALFFFPSYILSLLATIMAVNSTELFYSGKRPNWQTALTAVRQIWMRPLVMSIYVFVIMFAYSFVPRTFSALAGTTRARWLVAVIGAILEVYLMAVLSMGTVVSVLEERFCFEAVNVGWRLMEGRRFCGWGLAGFLVLVSSGIGCGFRVLRDGHDLMGVMYNGGLICLFGMVVLWSYVVNTVFYCECKRRYAIREDNAIKLDNL